MSGKLPKPKVAETIVKVSTFFSIYLATRPNKSFTKYIPIFFFPLFKLLNIERTFGAFPAHLGLEPRQWPSYVGIKVWIASFHDPWHATTPSNIFVQVLKCICTIIETYLSNYQNILHRYWIQVWRGHFYDSWHAFKGHQIFISKVSRILFKEQWHVQGSRALLVLNLIWSII